MKLINLIRARNVLLAHANDKLLAKIAYKMMKLFKASSDEDAFYNAKLKEIVEEYAQRDKDGNMVTDQHNNYKIVADRLGECKQAMSDLENTEVETPSIKFALDELSGLSLSMTEMYALDEFILQEG